MPSETKPNKNERGATMVEYGLIVVLIAVVAISVATNLGDNVTSMFSSVDSTLVSTN